MYAHQVCETLFMPVIGEKGKSIQNFLNFWRINLIKAQKFHLEDAHTLGQQLSDKIYNTGTTNSMRIPYDIVWLDWETDTAKMGILVIKEDDNYKVSPAWNVCKGLQWNVAGWPQKGWMVFPFAFNIKNLAYQPGDLLNIEVIGGLSDRVEDLEKSGENLASVLWGNFYLPLFAFCNLLSCKNIEALPHPPPAKLNKKRRKRGKTEIFTYHTLVIKPTTKRQVESQSKGLWSNRIHLCRGHFKEFTEEKPLFGKATGRFWWQPSVRGKNKEGVVIKDYRVRA